MQPAPSRDSTPDAGGGRQLALALLGYLSVVTVLITWAPLRFLSGPVHGWSQAWTPTDFALNVLMFLPLGFFAQSARTEATRDWWVVGLIGALFSAGLETGQLFIAGRYSSPVDIVANGAGAALGAWSWLRMRAWTSPDSRARPLLVLELPLTGLVLLLIPLLWVHALSSEGSPRAWLLLLVAAFGGMLLGAVHGGYLHRTGRLPRAGLLGITGLGFLVAAVPGARSHSGLLVAGAALAVGTAWLRSISAARARDRDGAQRVELRSVRFALPLFAAFFCLSSLWPLDAFGPAWRFAWSLSPGRTDLSNAAILQIIEHLAAFTLIGYVTAEFHGRENAPYRAVVPRVLAVVAALAVLMEGARGFNGVIGASGVVGVLAAGAGLFGGRLYHLQRDQVRALRQAGADARGVGLALVAPVAARPPADAAVEAIMHLEPEPVGR